MHIARVERTSPAEDIEDLPQDDGLRRTLVSEIARRPDTPKGSPLRLSIFAPGEPPRVALVARDTELGRNDLAGARCSDATMSRMHARLRPLRGYETWELVDCKATNTTRVNGRPERAAILKDGDVIRLGATLLIAEYGSFDDDARTPMISARTLRLGAELDAASGHDRPLLLLGPTGAGKTWCVERIERGLPAGTPFVHVNCATLTPELASAELFGHERGAFTGAARARDGLVAAAHRGVLFLDEIGTLPPAVQAQLLTCIERGRIRRVGANRETQIAVRYIAATNLDLHAAIASGAFREDLASRFGACRITVPPLAARRADILRLFCDALGVPPNHAVLHPDAHEALLLRRWPGNVRELRQVAATCAGLRRPIPIDRVLSPDEETCEAAPGRDDRPSADALCAALRAHAGNVAATARALGAHRTQVGRWIRAHGIDLGTMRAPRSR